MQMHVPQDSQGRNHGYINANGKQVELPPDMLIPSKSSTLCFPWAVNPLCCGSGPDDLTF